MQTSVQLVNSPAQPGTAKKACGVLAGTWDLLQTEATPAAESYGLQNGSDESTFDPDTRTMVPASAYGPNGKYRCKLSKLHLSMVILIFG